MTSALQRWCRGCGTGTQAPYRRTPENRQTRLAHSSAIATDDPDRVITWSPSFLQQRQNNMCRHTPKSKWSEVGPGKKRNCVCYAKWALSCPLVGTRWKQDLSAQNARLRPHESKSVAWLTTVNEEWAHHEIFNGVSQYIPKSDKATKDDIHLEEKEKD